jgi:hypothetical protein
MTNRLLGQGRCTPMGTTLIIIALEYGYVNDQPASHPSPQYTWSNPACLLALKLQSPHLHHHRLHGGSPDTLGCNHATRPAYPRRLVNPHAHELHHPRIPLLLGHHKRRTEPHPSRDCMCGTRKIRGARQRPKSLCCSCCSRATASLAPSGDEHARARPVPTWRTKLWWRVKTCWR